jgi:hypothetical protein
MLTLLVEFQLLHTPAAFQAERMAWRFVIYLNLIRSVRRYFCNANSSTATTHRFIEFLIPLPQTGKRMSPTQRPLPAMGKDPTRQRRQTRKLTVLLLTSMPNTAWRSPPLLIWREHSFAVCVKTMMKTRRPASEMGAHQVGLHPAASVPCERQATGSVHSPCGATAQNIGHRQLQFRGGKTLQIQCMSSTDLVTP